MRRLLRVAALLSIAGALYQGGILVWRSSFLQLDTVEVAGNLRVPPKEIVAASGLARGQHLLDISTSSVAGRVESIPWVLSARVERIVPSKVRVVVTERRPAAEVVAPGGSLLVDSRRVVLGRVGPVRAGERALVKVLDLPRAEAEPGAALDSPELAEALDIIAALPAGIRKELTAVSAPSAARITLQLASGPSVVFGSSEDAAQKGAALKAVLGRLESTGTRAASIDVTVPDRPAVLPS